MKLSVIITHYFSKLENNCPTPWAPAGGGGSRVGRRSPPWKKCFLYIGAFCYVFLIMGPFSPCGGLLATFYSMVEALFNSPPQKKTKKNSCGR